MLALVTAPFLSAVAGTPQVFVGGMPYSYSQEQVEEYWSWCGEIEELDIMTFPDTGRFRCGCHAVLVG